jgi:hypothetical protein
LRLDRQIVKQHTGTSYGGAGNERPARQRFLVHETPLKLEVRPTFAISGGG